METGIFIRAQVDGKWDSVDIGDSRLPDIDIVRRLRSRGEKNEWAEQCVMILLGRTPQIVKTVP